MTNSKSYLEFILSYEKALVFWALKHSCLSHFAFALRFKSWSKFHLPLEFYSAIFRPVELCTALFCVEILKGISILMGKILISIVLNLKKQQFSWYRKLDMWGNLTLLSMVNIWWQKILKEPNSKGKGLSVHSYLRYLKLLIKHKWWIQLLLWSKNINFT